MPKNVKFMQAIYYKYSAWGENPKILAKNTPLQIFPNSMEK